MPCAICEIRKPRRLCPAVHGEICTVCCATGREESIDCPPACEYLRDAHRHEKKPEIDISQVPNQDIEVTESFIGENHILFTFIAIALFDGVAELPESTDWDVREAFISLIQTYRALKSGIYYDAHSANVYANRIADRVQESIGEIQKREMTASGKNSIRDSDVLVVLAFLQRIEYSHNNGRKRCRAFIDFLSGFCRTENDAEQSGLLNPGRVKTDFLGKHDPTELMLPPDEPLIVL